MTIGQKKELLKTWLANNITELTRQAKIKLRKDIAKFSTVESLISDVAFVFLEKIESKENIIRYHQMLEENKLLAYMGKAVDNNARFVNAPFLKKELALLNRIQLNTNIDFSDSGPDEHVQLIEDLYDILKGQELKELLGNSWKYHLTLFNEYLTIGNSYSKIAEKYNIPKSAVHKSINYTKTNIKTLIVYEDYI